MKTSIIKRYTIQGAILAIILFAVGSVQSADELFTESFDNLSTGVLHRQNGWLSDRQNDAQVQTETAFAGTQAGTVSTNATVWHSFTNTAATNVWVDFYARVPYPGDADPPALTGSVAAAFFVTDSGALKAVSNNTWVMLNYTVPADTWQRFTMHLDYKTKRWELFAADDTPNRLLTVIATNLAFSASSTNTYLRRFRIKN
jgi:hypothetical protein